MPIIYQCDNCGWDYTDLDEERHCSVCELGVCNQCKDNESRCYACSERDLDAIDDGVDDDDLGRVFETEDIDWDERDGD